MSREDAALLEGPNNILGVEYCKSLLRRGSHVTPLTIPRRGAAHDGSPAEGETIASASAIRTLLRSGERDRALDLMAPSMAAAYVKEEAAGRAPVFAETCERAVLARLRRMVLWAYLGLTPAAFPEEVPYLRPLAANAVGRDLLGRMRKTASVPVLAKAGAVRRMDESARALFDLQVRAADLYALAYPDLSAAAGGAAWRDGPVMC